MTLIPLTDVRALIPQDSFTDAQLNVTMGLVAGWLQTAAGLAAPPDSLSPTDQLYAPALELVALVADNPTSLASRTAGPTSRMWPLASRRDAVLDRVRQMYRGQPTGSFPCPIPLPDPVIVPWSFRWQR